MQVYHAIGDASPHCAPSVYLGRLLQALQNHYLTIKEIMDMVGGTEYQTERGLEKLDDMQDVEITTHNPQGD